jgi:hypothetical protein
VPFPIGRQSRLMRIIAVMLGLAALVAFLQTRTWSIPSGSELQLTHWIVQMQRVGSTNSVPYLKQELQREHDTRRHWAAVALWWSCFLGLLAVLAWRFADYLKRSGYPFETRFFEPLRRTRFNTARRVSGPVLAREERLAEARFTLRPTLERLFGSKRE